MPRKIMIFMSAVLSSSILLSGCGSSGVKASDKALSCANQAIEIGEDYLSGDKSGKDAVDALQDLSDDMDYTKDLSSDDENKTADSSIGIAILGLAIDVNKDNYDSDKDTYSEVQNDVDSLKKKAKEFK